LELVGKGEEGEICLSGKGLARGYLNRPELSAEKFIQNPFLAGERLYRTGDVGLWTEDGQLEFTGRQDDQLKIRGFRIELGEIEFHLNQLNEISEAVVVAKRNSESDVSLQVFYTADETLSREHLIQALLISIPKYMIPDSFTRLQSIPLTSNGKIDKKKLLTMVDDDNRSSEYVNPENEIEEALVQIWKEVLNKDRIGVLDNFFELGGHSLKAIRVLTIVENQMNVKLDFKKIFNAQTIRELALEIENIQWLKEGQKVEAVKKVII